MTTYRQALAGPGHPTRRIAERAAARAAAVLRIAPPEIRYFTPTSAPQPGWHVFDNRGDLNGMVRVRYPWQPEEIWIRLDLPPERVPEVVFHEVHHVRFNQVFGQWDLFERAEQLAEVFARRFTARLQR